MTVLGAIIRPERAVVWCDTEVYTACQPSGEAAKLALNPWLAVVGAGNMTLVREAARTAQESISIDQAEAKLPTALRARAAALAPKLVKDNPAWCSGQVVISAGYSPRAGRVVAWQFGGPSFFEPILVSRLSLPTDSGLEDDLQRVDSMPKIVALARRQIALLRLRGLPDATGRSLIVAEITQFSMHCQRIPDFDVQPSHCAVAACPPSSPMAVREPMAL